MKIKITQKMLARKSMTVPVKFQMTMVIFCKRDFSKSSAFLKMAFRESSGYWL